MNNFRKIDIDAIEDDYLNDDDLLEIDPRSEQDALSYFTSLQAQVRGLVNGGDVTNALGLILDDPPYGPTVDSARKINTDTVIQILSSTRTSDISNVINNLQPNQQDNLMKYIYKCMSLPVAEQIGNVFLSWHEKLTQVAALAVGVTAWNDGNSEVDSNSFSLLIEKSVGDADDEFNKSINTSLQTEKSPILNIPKNKFVIRGNQCYQSVGLPPRDDLPESPYVNIGLGHCRDQDNDDLQIIYAGNTINVGKDDRCRLVNDDNLSVRCVIPI
ncbi:hypothetical protein E3Q22_00996 [Wallemia mellicola]|uniref:Actin-related protein 2/3 complex subunit 5 n=1 Tax=Wallemia mellicola TaxID=1708541 RepID=A0A4T0ND26_9BASI|nr:hypothetical protein E3Q23_00634 [Wallemia mellicola]TIB81497.1 hypothetical protein E3Q22_00996 [Wallemia mellicola]TIB90503.1 hypothetical protein E3Q21_00252 [Wallemia mellicola]TIB92083.1 hypothetical protein E3Q20_00427 [Wallemia mellicola]TIB93918.1 hypothetical protein E3Q19_00770 [Wallemia mellicola]